MSATDDGKEGSVDAGAIRDGLATVRERLESACAAARRERAPRLVAVSKTKPAEAALAAYDAGQRYFGENYVQELAEKAPRLPADARWHFIGAFQTNKARALLAVPGLWCVESVDRAKAADALQRAAHAAGRLMFDASEGGNVAGDGTSDAGGGQGPLRVMVQVNTSGEASKAGCAPEDAPALARHVADKCPLLRLVGLMTIGAPDDSDEPIAFTRLAECRRCVADELGVNANELELSMGMSGDFERAIRMGSDSVRVGSSIFGARVYANKA